MPDKNWIESNESFIEICVCHARDAGMHNQTENVQRDTIAKVDPRTGKVFVYDGKSVVVKQQ